MNASSSCTQERVLLKPHFALSDRQVPLADLSNRRLSCPTRDRFTVRQYASVLLVMEGIRARQVRSIVF